VYPHCELLGLKLEGGVPIKYSRVNVILEYRRSWCFFYRSRLLLTILGEGSHLHTIEAVERGNRM